MCIIVCNYGMYWFMIVQCPLHLYYISVYFCCSWVRICLCAWFTAFCVLFSFSTDIVAQDMAATLKVLYALFKKHKNKWSPINHFNCLWWTFLWRSWHQLLIRLECNVVPNILYIRKLWKWFRHSRQVLIKRANNGSLSTSHRLAVDGDSMVTPPPPRHFTLPLTPLCSLIERSSLSVSLVLMDRMHYGSPTCS